MPRDYTKYIFTKTYGKGRLVLAVIRDYVSENPNISFNELKEAFPKSIRGDGSTIGVFSRIENIPTEKEDQYFMKKIETITLSDCTIAVRRKLWGAGEHENNLKRFIKNARSLGYDIQPIEND